MKKTVLLLSAVLFSTLCALADEGMWLPSLISSRINDMQAKGFKLSAEDIYSVNRASMKDAVVLFNGGCTGEIVSGEGLLLTNHHCGYGAIQHLSTVDHDYLTYGFWAMSKAEELPCEGLWVDFLVRMEDITARLENGETVNDIMEAAKAEGVGYRASTEKMYYGNQTFLFVWQHFEDVRLVGAPPSSIGKFGGDTDNWIWPRHTGDFSVFRVYADADNNPAAYSSDNRPYTPRRFFPVSTKGVEEGDFTMIYGFPGNTQEYVISDAVEYVERSDRMKIELRTIRLDIISAAQEADPEVRIQYAAKHANIANAWKKWQGELLGLERLGTVAKKRDYERLFTLWAANRPQYADLLDSMHMAYGENCEAYWLAELYRESVGAIELPAFVRGVSAIGNPEDLKRRTESFFKDFNADIDRDVAVKMIEYYLCHTREDDAALRLKELVGKHGGVEKYADYIYANTRYLTPEGFLAESDGADPIDELNELLAGAAGHASRYRYRNVSDIPEIARWYKTYMQALMEWDRMRPFYPDANLTLRVAYGSVAGYEYADGEYHRHYTTVDGVIAKDDPSIYDYDVPQVLRELYGSKEYGRHGVELRGRTTVPVCFLATNHTSGGNSGSPVINGSGELVGINFDRTWVSTMSDLEFDPSICRNISVDIRYVLFVIDKVGGAGWLLEEMNLR